jgi:hypothetical protein
MNRPLLALALLAALASACGNDKPLTAEEARAALPHAAVAQVGAPSASAGATGLTAEGGRATAAVSNSAFFNLSTALAFSVNTGVGATLGVLQAVVSLPPTKCEADTCTWGPGAGPLDYNVHRLTVTKVGDHYDFALAAEPKSQPGSGFVTYLSGSAFPGAAPRRGHGTFTVDFDEAAKFDGPHGDDTGSIVVQYDARTTPAIGVQFLGMVDRENPGTGAVPNKVNAAYAFAATGAGGDLQVAFRTLAPNAPKTLSLHARWDATGAGRGDVEFGAAGFTYQESECWAGGASAFALVYDTNPATGAEAACAYQPAAYATLQAP